MPWSHYIFCSFIFTGGFLFNCTFSTGSKWLLSYLLPCEEDDDDDLQEHLSFMSEVKEEEAVTKVVQQTYDSNEYTLQGDAYIAAAIKNFEEGNTALAEYFTEKANESYSLAEDIKIATTLQE